LKEDSKLQENNIDDYITLQEQFRSGNYEYETLRSKEDIFRAYEVGKKIVFTAHRSRSFFILAPEGVVYRRFRGNIRLYSWKELNIIPYSVTSTISMGGLLKTELGSFIEVHIILPNGSLLKFRPDDYDLSEFVSLKKMREKLRVISKIDKIPRYKITTFLQETKQLALALAVLAFEYYSNPSKEKFETRPSLSTIRKKNMLEAQKKDANKEPIFQYLKKNSGKAYTVQSLYNRINDLGLNEEAKNNLDLDALGQILVDLSMNGKITRQVKEGIIFYSF